MTLVSVKGLAVVGLICAVIATLIWWQFRTDITAAKTRDAVQPSSRNVR